MPRSNNKEAEDCYQRKGWEKKKGLSFFKIIQPSCLQHGRLAIPKTFSRDFRKKLFPTAVLQVPNKKEWHVELREDDGQVWFQNGWKDFMEYHSICVGHLLVFKYDGYSGFNVVIFDMTACEIEYPCDPDDYLEELSNENESESPGFQKQGKRISAPLARNKRKQEADTGNRNLFVGNEESTIRQEEIGKVGQRSSKFCGVNRSKRNGKFEVCLSFEGKRVYLGTYDSEEKAAQIHDLAALKYRGPTFTRKLNFPNSNYEKQLEEMNTMSWEEYVTFLRRNINLYVKSMGVNFQEKV